MHGVQTSFSLEAFQDGVPSLTEDRLNDLYALENFKWYCREVAFPPLSLPSDYKDQCLDFDLVSAEEATQNFGDPEMP